MTDKRIDPSNKKKDRRALAPRNTAGLAAHAERKAQDTRRRVSQAIDLLLDGREAINFNTVAKAAGVAKSYLYNQNVLRVRIEALRHEQGQARLVLVSSSDGKLTADRRKTDKSKDMILAAKDRRIEELESELKKLKEELKRLNGKLYERL